MPSTRINTRFVITIGIVLVTLSGSILLKHYFDTRAHVREREMLREAARFLLENATNRSADTIRFRPLSSEERIAFESQFRDRTDTPIFYDPWTPFGEPIEMSESNRSDIIAYALTLTPDGQRAIVTADLGVYYVPDTQIDWPLRQHGAR